MIGHKTQTLDFQKDISDLLCQVDRKLAGDAKSKLDTLRYGAKDCADEDVFFILRTYKNILIAKVSNNSCLCDYSLDDIISNIKQYLSSGKLLKFKN